VQIPSPSRAHANARSRSSRGVSVSCDSPHRVVAREPCQQRLDPHAAAQRPDRRGVDRVQPLVLEDQLAAPLEQPRLAPGAGQPVAVDRPGRPH
jgi:hypothetical protein